MRYDFEQSAFLSGDGRAEKVTAYQRFLGMVNKHPVIFMVGSMSGGILLLKYVLSPLLGDLFMHYVPNPPEHIKGFYKPLGR